MPWDADPRAEPVVRDQLLSLLPENDAQAVREVLEEGTGVRQLSAAARAVHDVLINEDPRRTSGLARRLPERIRQRLAVVSPTAVADGLSDVPVVAMHSRDDPVIPHGELRRLGAAVPHARLLDVDSLEHAELSITSPGGWIGAVGDLVTIWSFTTAVLRWQEPTWPWGAG